MEWKNWIRKLLSNRALQVDIVTIFLVLVSATSLCIISYTYSKNYQSIMDLSLSTIQRTSALVTEKIDCLIHDFEQVPGAASGLIQSRTDVSMNNRTLMTYMEGLVVTHPDITAFYVGTSDGTLLEIINLPVAEQTNFLSKPSVKLPSNCLYAIRLVDRSTPNPKETLYYFDKDFKGVTQEIISPVVFDSRSRPWYMGAQGTKGLFWTSIYLYDPTGEPGITVAQPLFNDKGEMIGAVGADLSLAFFSKFLNSQKVGISGRALILNNTSGDILLPIESQTNKNSNVSDVVIAKAYRNFIDSKQNNFLLTEDKTQYLAAITVFPIAVKNEWLVTVIAPLSDYFGEILATQKKIVLISVGIFLIASVFVVFFSKRISRPITTLAKEIDKIKHLELASTLRVHSNILEINTLDSSIAAMRSTITSFAKYVPKEIVRQLIGRGQEITLAGEKKNLTILFCDIVGFTPITEKIPVDLLMPLLAEYFDGMSRIILENEGTIDKYIGDSIMAFWGAPKELSKPWMHACDAALSCQSLLKTLNAERIAKGDPPFFTKFGIDTGMVIVGNIGTSERMNYTAIGDPVNTAARLQTVNATYHTSIIISENVYQHIKEDYLTRPLDVVTVKGKLSTIKIYELIEKNTSPTELQKLLAKDFTAAYSEMELGNKDKALTLFQQLSQIFPEDEPTKIQIKKILGSKN
ncbi:MAG: cache domain-containing protein [Chlamydiae bacterium]|nr:cache domain-containing protein [Chlamydiota bacterium]